MPKESYYYVSKDNSKRLVMVVSVNHGTVLFYPIGATGMMVDIATINTIGHFNQKYREYNP